MNEVYRALSDPTRRRILALLRTGDMTAGEVQSQFEQSWPTISAHLRVLREADLVQADRHGTSITYHLNVSLLERALARLLETLGVERVESSA
jgi:ArsR family transcriptional regulator